MVEQLNDPDPEVIRANLAEIRERIAASAAQAGRAAEDVEVLAATKYVTSEGMGALAEAGVKFVGENRAQDLQSKQEQWGDLFTWDFIGDLQSRKVPQLAGRVRLIHSVGSDSALSKLSRDDTRSQPILVQVNIADEPTKGGIAPEDLGRFLDLAECPVEGLMTMPPLAADPEENRRWFAAMRDLAERFGLSQLSMGTSQDYEVAVEEGATIVRIGAVLCRPPGS